MKLLLRWVIGIVALVAAVLIVPEMSVQGEGWAAFAVTALVLGLANLIVRPLIKLVTLPINVMTLGLFSFVINGIVLLLAGWLSVEIFGVGLVVDGFLPAILGALIISVVTTVLGWTLVRE